MILPSFLIKFSIVNAHPVANDSSSLYHFIMFIFYNREPTFLWNTMNGTYPFTLLHMKDDACIQKTYCFFSYLLFHVRFKTSLKVRHWLSSFFHEYSMGGYRRTNPLQVTHSSITQEHFGACEEPSLNFSPLFLGG